MCGLQTVPQCPYQIDPSDKRCPSDGIHLENSFIQREYSLLTIECATETIVSNNRNYYIFLSLLLTALVILKISNTKNMLNFEGNLHLISDKQKCQRMSVHAE